MTVIAIDQRNLIAYADSRSTVDCKVPTAYDTPKLHRITAGKYRGGVLGWCGDCGQAASLRATFLRSEHPKNYDDMNECSFLVLLPDGRVLVFDGTDPTEVPANNTGVVAMGSGQLPVRAALLAGASFPEAMRIGCQLVYDCGEPIQSMAVDLTMVREARSLRPVTTSAAACSRRKVA